MESTMGRPSLVRIKEESSVKKYFQCEFCEKNFLMLKTLRIHKLIHYGEEKHVCQYCAMTFTQGDHLNAHMLIHAGEKPFVCPIPRCETRHRDVNRKCSDHPEEKLIRDKNWWPKKKFGARKIQHLEEKLKRDENYEFGKKDIVNNMEKSMEKEDNITEKNSIQFQGCFWYTPRRPYTAIRPRRLEFKRRKLDTMEIVSETDPEKEPEKLVKSQSTFNEDHQASKARARMANTVDHEIARCNAARDLLQLKESARICSLNEVSPW